MWNHRVLAHKVQGQKEIYLEIHEVYYDDNNKPNGYTKDPVSVGGSDKKEIIWALNRMLESVDKPILWADEKFPAVY